MGQTELRDEKRRRLLQLIRELAYREGDFTLRSGEKSQFYLDGKQVTMTAEGAALFAELILERLRGTGVQAVGGPTLGADPIVGAVSALSFRSNTPLASLIVRKEEKDHGTGKLVEGPTLPAGALVAVVEDVVTRGGAVMHAIRALEGAGYRIARVFCLVDRQSTGGDELRSAGYEFEPVFTLSDVVNAGN